MKSLFPLLCLPALAAAAILTGCQSAPPDVPSSAASPAPGFGAGRDDPNQIAFGRRVAQHHCAECHALDPGQASPLADAPPFPVLYQRFPVERIGQSIERGMMVGHPRMPLLAHLDEDEETALVAYLSSFRRNLDGQAPRP